MAWYDFYKLWTYAFTDDPLERQAKRDITGAGVTQPDAIPDIRQDGSFWGGGKGTVRLRDSNDFIDLSSVSNRQSRYKEYERLRNVPEIESVMDIYADESCLAGNMKISTPMFGNKPIRWFAENKPGERFLVYCWDAELRDFTLGWAYNAHKVKTALTIRIMLDDGSKFIVTPEHRMLMRDGEWKMAGELEFGDRLMPFYREKPSVFFNNDLKVKQFPRIRTFAHGWKTERTFIDQWRTGKSSKDDETFSDINQLMTGGYTAKEISKIIGCTTHKIKRVLRDSGFSNKEIKQLGKKEDYRRVICTEEWETIDVYDVSVEKHKNFCGESVIYHNCQRGEDGHIFKIKVDNQDVKEELEYLMFHRNMLNFDDPSVGWNYVKKTYLNGDHFFEVVINPEKPKMGILKLQELPVDSIYRIETTKGKLIEFQQSNEGPDYQSLTRAPVTQATEADLQQATAIRFTAEQVVHTKVGDDRKTFYPYGVSLVEPARGPAHQLRLMEDAMVVYRLCLIGNTKIRTKNGWKYIKDVNIGDIVYCYKNGKIQETKVISSGSNGVQDVYRIRSRHVEITGNDIHPILVERDGKLQYVKIKDLIVKKDKIINTIKHNEEKTKIPRIISEKWAKLDWSQKTAFRNSNYENISELMRQCSAKFDRVKQFLYVDCKCLPYNQAVEICDIFDLDESKLIICNKGEIRSERITIPEYVDEEFAKLFGFLIGDGSIDKYRVVFAAGVVKEQNEYYADLLRKYFGKTEHQEDKRGYPGNYACSSTVAANIFKKLGYIAGAKNKRIPNWVFNSSKEIRIAFIEGLCDADGCNRRTKKGTWFSTIELCNNKLVEDIKEVWSSVGLASGHISSRKREGGHEIEPGRKMKPSVSFQVTISEKELSEKENICSIEHIGKQEVFDLSVEDDSHNFIANGTPTHNSRAPERRVFYIDIGNLSPARAEAFMERIKDQFRKKKVATTRGGGPGASAVEERWHPPAIDEDYWLPLRTGANTRIDTLPGAQNLGEVDDALYFRNKLFTALKFPKDYFSSEDPNRSRVTLSSQDTKFARIVERLQAHISKSIVQICETHLRLRGVPEEDYEDLQVILTPPSEWRELSKQEIISNRINWAGSLKGGMLMPDYDILKRILQYDEDEIEEMMARMKIQKLEDFKLQVLAQNPQLLGVGSPSPDEQEMGTEAGGPGPMLGEEPGPEGGEQQPGQEPPQGGDQAPGQEPQLQQGQSSTGTVPDATPDEIKKYDLEMQSYDLEQDVEEIDYTEV